MPDPRLIVGLGNPGKDYEWTRHNLGFLVVQRFALKLGVKFENSSFTKALIAETKLDGRNVGLVLPMTYMNNSGLAVRKIVDQKQMEFKDVMVVCDDINLEFGQIRVKSKGNDGGHNGLKSIIEHLHSQDFPRLRLGIGQPKPENIIKFVLEKFNNKEKREIESLIEEAAECCHVWIREGITKAMDQFNRRKGHE